MAPGKRKAAEADPETEQANKLRSVCKAMDDSAAEFCCPITQELPIDPVTAEDGRVYERSAIEEWLEKNEKSPHTNEPMGKKLLPALQVKNMIASMVKSGALSGDKCAAWTQKLEQEKKVEEVRQRMVNADDNRVLQWPTAYEPLTIEERGRIREAVRRVRADNPSDVDQLDVKGALYGLPPRIQAGPGREDAVAYNDRLERDRNFGATYQKLSGNMPLDPRTIDNAVYQMQGKLDEALELYEQALAIQKAALGDMHTSVADSQFNMALVHKKTGDRAKAKALFEQSAAICMQAYGPDHRYTTDALQAAHGCA